MIGSVPSIGEGTPSPPGQEERTVKRFPVTSSNIVSVGWEPGPPPLCGTMEVEFKHGAVYRYSGVPAAVALQVTMGALNGSVGSTFHALVRSQSYPYERVRDE